MGMPGDTTRIKHTGEIESMAGLHMEGIRGVPVAIHLKKVFSYFDQIFYVDSHILIRLSMLILIF